MREVKPSFCRLCHALCGILVEIENGRAVRVTGDHENPIYGGYTCAKGRALPDQHYHPERLLHSQKRRSYGSFAAIPHGQALDELAGRLGAIVREHGPRAVALYWGTYSTYPAA